MSTKDSLAEAYQVRNLSLYIKGANMYVRVKVSRLYPPNEGSLGLA